MRRSSCGSAIRTRCQAAEPGVEPAPQSAEAKLVDATVTDWFGRYLN